MKRIDPAPRQDLRKFHVFLGSSVRRQDETDGSCPPGSRSMEMSRQILFLISELNKSLTQVTKFARLAQIQVRRATRAPHS